MRTLPPGRTQPIEKGGLEVQVEVGVQLHVSFPDVRFSCVVAGNDERQFRRRKATRDGPGVGESVRTLEPEAGPRLKSTTGPDWTGKN